MNNVLIVEHGSGVSADYLLLKVKALDNPVGQQTIFEDKYWFGYDVSWDPALATDKKPYAKDLIEKIRQKYDCREVQEIEGNSIFKESLEEEYER